MTMNRFFLSAAACLLAASSLFAQDNILDMRENYNIGDVVTVTGVVTSDDNLGSVRYLQDATAGIALYPGADWSDWDATPAIGDSLTVTGEITEYNGLLEVGPNLSAVTFQGTGMVPEPQVVLPSALGEGLEGELVRINGVTFPLAGQEITANTYDFTADGETGIIYVRNSNSLVGETLTGCAVDLIGIVSQFSFDGFGGYQLLPRGPVDLIPASGICYTSPVVQTNMSDHQASPSRGARTSPLTASSNTASLRHCGMSAAGAAGTAEHSVDLTGLEAGQIYLRAGHFDLARWRGCGLHPFAPTPPYRLPLATSTSTSTVQWTCQCGHRRRGRVPGHGHERYRGGLDHFCPIHIGRGRVQLQRPDLGGRL